MILQIHIDRNADTDLLFNFTDAAGQNVDLTGYRLKMQVRLLPRSAALFDELSTENGRLIIEETGTVRAKITAASTMQYFAAQCHFDILATDATGRQTRIAEGVLITSPEVTI